MRRLAQVFFWGYTAMLLGVGFSGMFIARWELTTVFSLPLVKGTVLTATLSSQYRFLKAMEFTFGLFCATHFREIFRPGPEHNLFLTGVFAGVIARLLGWGLDGTPQIAFVIFAGLELVTGLLVGTTVRAKAEAYT